MNDPRAAGCGRCLPPLAPDGEDDGDYADRLRAYLDACLPRGVFAFAVLLTVLFAGLKLGGVIRWPWPMVACPSWLYGAFFSLAWLVARAVIAGTAEASAGTEAGAKTETSTEERNDQ